MYATIVGIVDVHITYVSEVYIHIAINIHFFDIIWIMLELIELLEQ